MKHDWSYTVYGNVQEIIPNNCPKSLGKSVTTTTTLDANLLHCLATGASPTACLHFCHQTPTDWYSKKQATVETATYGSQFVAANTAICLKDECYFDKFQSDIIITAKSHDVSEILDPMFTPGPSQEEKELVEAKQVFMYKVFNDNILTDNGQN